MPLFKACYRHYGNTISVPCWVASESWRGIQKSGATEILNSFLNRIVIRCPSLGYFFRISFRNITLEVSRGEIIGHKSKSRSKNIPLRLSCLTEYSLYQSKRDRTNYLKFCSLFILVLLRNKDQTCENRMKYYQPPFQIATQNHCLTSLPPGSFDSSIVWVAIVQEFNQI